MNAKKQYLENILISLLALIIIVVINFFLLHLNGVDPFYALSGIDGDINEVVKEKLLVEYGLDKPLIVQFFIYLKNMFTFNLGYSYQSNIAVLDLIFKRLPVTLMITLPALILSSILGLILGLVVSYQEKKPISKIINAIIYILHALPGFVLALFILLLFGFKLEWFPLGGKNSLIVSNDALSLFLDTVYHLILPVLTLTLIMLPNNYFMMKKLVDGEKNKKYVTYALSRGYRSHHIMYKEIFPNVKSSYLMHVGNHFATLLSSALIIENIFSLNGLGTLIYNAALTSDYPSALGALFIASLFGVIISIIFDIICWSITPKVRKES